MADGSHIEWTDATWQIVTGCSIVSPGCTNCYAMKLAGTRLRNHPSRAGLTKESKGGPVWTGETRFNEKWLTQPLSWKEPRNIFVAAHGDLFHEDVPDEVLDKVFAVMALAPQHTFQVLTKRSVRMRQYFNGPFPTGDGVMARIAEQMTLMRPAPAQVTPGQHWTDCPVGPIDRDGFPEFGWRRFIKPSPLPNVWLGVSVERQQEADERIPDLLATPAAVRFISAEPLLGPIDLRCTQHGKTRLDTLTGEVQTRRKYPDNGVGDYEPHGNLGGKLDWVIVGGESGPGARAMHPVWARSLRDQCAAAGVAFFFKQWGAYKPFALPSNAVIARDSFMLNGRHFPFEQIEGYALVRVGKKGSGRILDGVEHSAMPEARA